MRTLTLPMLLLCAACSVQAQDPANGWMAYAVGAMPSKYERITFLQMTWTVSDDPTPGRAFFSPWFGMDPSDNLNLIQPVNPWSGRSWSMYTEYFQWEPEHNSNSPQRPVEAGQTLVGTLRYMPMYDSYNLTQEVVETGAVSHQTVKCQNGKKYTVPYVVYEKVFPCSSYPPDGIVTFRNIVAYCGTGVGSRDCTKEIEWTPKVKDANCNMQAHVNSANNTISITWDTRAASRVDNFTDQQLFDLNHHGWATKLGLERPSR